MSRPSTFTQEMADKILEGIIEGESLRSLCSAEDMPAPSTVCKWLTQNEDFREQYTRAREAQGDTMDDLILDEAKAVTPETANAVRVRIDAYKWRASKLKPKVYGDRQTIEHEGEVALIDRLKAAQDRASGKSEG